VRPVIDGTADVLYGPSSEAEWPRWYEAMLELRRPDPYGARHWSDTSFRQLFLFLYDESVFDRARLAYRTTELVAAWRSMFGRIDSVLLWHAYPRLGFDRRTQFDFYRDMPGGLDGLRAGLCDVLHAHGIRVFLDYNPWDAGGARAISHEHTASLATPPAYEELAEIARALDADGIMLDTMTDAPERLEAALDRPLVLAPELRPRLEDLARHRQAWAQWIDRGDPSRASILRHSWLVPRHRQFTIRRWDTSRWDDIVYSFWNGSGLLLWDNVFGTWNPYSPRDRKLIAETGAIFDRYAEVFGYGRWEPLVPTGVSGLDANRFVHPDTTIWTIRNRSDRPLRFSLPDGAWTAFWDRNASGGVTVAPHGIEVLVSGDASAAVHHFLECGRAAEVERAHYEERAPLPRAATAPRNLALATDRFVPLAGGRLRSVVRHPRRECGCYEHVWGWYYEDIVEHVIDEEIAPFAMRRTAVTNADYLAFVHRTSYRPRDEEHFLQHLRTGDAALPRELPSEVGALPVTFVSLDDARAYASAVGEALPTELEWQWAAGSRVYPWGDDPRVFDDVLRPAEDEITATPDGVLGLSGNAWEWTESEMSDGHTRFAMLRGGTHLPPGASVWLPERGARPNHSHAKYILLGDGLDRSATISFRTVRRVT
jgi:hypothetical protein